MGKLIIEDIELFAYHGHFDEEKTIGSRYLVNIEIELTNEKSCKTDCLEDTYNYQRAYDIISAEMRQASSLLESIGNRIAEKILKDSEMIRSVTVKVAKMNPPMGGNVKSVAVEVTQKR
jgi:dihydroneopterin aldolase